MNSEELELSLRTEFENYLKDVFAGMRRDVADFQKNFEAEFEKHKAQMDEAFRGLSARFESDSQFDQAFTESVVEHLRLARDDGAQLSALAFSEAQQLEQSSASADYDRLRDGITDISSQTTQSAILKSLVDNASQFAPRGAFFIVKHDSFVCWRRFDGGVHADDDNVRSVRFDIDSDTVLADAVRSLSTKESDSSSHTEDSVYLGPLGFSQPDRMYAVPLIARGRGVAVFYVDGGFDGSSVNVEAIESLVRVAGLTVELRAASAAAAAQPAPSETPTYVPMQTQEQRQDEETQAAADDASAEETYNARDYELDSSAPAEEAFDATEYEEYSGAVAVEDQHDSYDAESESHVETQAETSDVEHPVEVSYEESNIEPEYPAVEVSEPAPEKPVSDFAFASSDAYDASSQVDAGPQPVEEYAYSGETTNGMNGHAYEATPEPVVEVATVQPAKSRLSDRHVDLPIEVTDEERRLHNDARRFARLLVSEIKLYNEQKVNEGREGGDLYDRLREAIDRSREMYDKRVKPEVAAKFDYFHYELVSNLAEGNDAKLGSSYPGATV